MVYVYLLRHFLFISGGPSDTTLSVEGAMGEHNANEKWADSVEGRRGDSVEERYLILGSRVTVTCTSRGLPPPSLLLHICRDDVCSTDDKQVSVIILPHVSLTQPFKSALSYTLKF